MDIINLSIAKKALDALEVDEFGLDEMDKDILLAIIEKYNGGPVGLNTLPLLLMKIPELLKKYMNPFLIQQGFIHRTPRGREATDLAYKRFGKTRKSGKASLFD
jgi:holliday junction DNA helicase RuvB